MSSRANWWSFGLALAALAILIPVYWIAWHAPAIGMFHDDGVYLVTAKALATGHGYRIISLPDEIPQTKYPILFPLILSWIWRLAPDFPDNGVYLKLAPLCFAFLWYSISFRLIAREGGRLAATLAVVLTAALVWSIYLSTALLSETLFAALCTGCLYLLRGMELGKPDGKLWIAAAALAGLAFITRTAGVCAILAGVLFFLRRHQWGRAAKFTTVALIVAGPWLYWMASQHPPQTDAYYAATNYGSWNVLSRFFSMDKKVAIVFLNALTLLRAPWSIAGVGWDGRLEALASIALLIAAVRWISLTVVETFLAIYAGVMLAWAWPPDRFLVVVYPLILFSAARMWRAVRERYPLRATPMYIAAAILLAAVLIPCFRNAIDAARTTLRTGVATAVGVQDSWNDTQQQLTWIRDDTPSDAVILANLDPVFYLYTGRKSVRGFLADPYRLFYMPETDAHPIGTLADFTTTLAQDKVAYIVRAPNKGFAEAPWLDRLISEMAASQPNAIHLVAQGRDPRFQIYQFTNQR